MRKGFTLVELLAVIVILAIILAIAIPGISNIIESSKRGAAESDVRMLFKAIEYKMLEQDNFDSTTMTEDNVEEQLGISASNYERLTVKKMNGQIYMTVVGADKWKGLVISGTKKNIRVDEAVTVSEEKANAPVLATGMIPVKWYVNPEDAEDKYWITTTVNDPEWYEYGTTPTTRWANVIQVTNESREEYLTPNTEVDVVNDVIAMWVWIPRYVYKIRPAKDGSNQDIPNTGWHKQNVGIIDIQFSRGVDDNWNKDEVGPIDLREGAEASDALTNGGKYTNHPAFTFGDTELTGLWVSKFEMSGSSNALNSKPNVASYRNIMIGNMFAYSREVEVNPRYGWENSGKGIDTHMMKNTEWGVVTYLANSTYGKNAEIWINNSSAYTTGCAGNSVSEGEYLGCQNAYDSTIGFEASTTGNIYGIYDLSGNTAEYTAAYVNNNNINLNTNGSAIINADNKYKDVYLQGVGDARISNYALAINYKGDAIYEVGSSGDGTTAWYGDVSYMPYSNDPWFYRGGHCGHGVTAGYFYSSGNSGIGVGNYVGFHTVVLVGPGL